MCVCSLPTYGVCTKQYHTCKRCMSDECNMMFVQNNTITVCQMNVNMVFVQNNTITVMDVCEMNVNTVFVQSNTITVMDVSEE